MPTHAAVFPPALLPVAFVAAASVLLSACAERDDEQTDAPAAEDEVWRPLTPSPFDACGPVEAYAGCTATGHIPGSGGPIPFTITWDDRARLLEVATEALGHEYSWQSFTMTSYNTTVTGGAHRTIRSDGQLQHATEGYGLLQTSRRWTYSAEGFEDGLAFESGGCTTTWSGLDGDTWTRSRACAVEHWSTVTEYTNEDVVVPRLGLHAPLWSLELPRDIVLVPSGQPEVIQRTRIGETSEVTLTASYRDDCQPETFETDGTTYTWTYDEKGRVTSFTAGRRTAVVDTYTCPGDR